MLIGAGQNTTTINGQSGPYTIELKGNVDDVTIAGFTVANGSTGQALKIEQSSANNNITVENNTFVSGDGGHAVYAGNLTNSNFNNNTFESLSGEDVTILVYIENASSNNVNFDGNTFSGDLGNNLAFGSLADGSTFKNNDFSAITATGKDKLVEFLNVTADASAGGNLYPTGAVWYTVNGGQSDFKGVYLQTKANNVAVSGDTVTLVN